VRKNFKIVHKCGRDQFGGFRALEWAWQKVFWQIDRNSHDYKIMTKYPTIFQNGSVGKLFGKSIEVYKTNKIAN